MMAQSVPHPATDKKRVKVYELRNNDWFDRGTGFCTYSVVTDEDGRQEPRVLVESEDHPERLLLETRIVKSEQMQKQQETLIVWQDPSTSLDMALSFQEAEGCAMIWRFVDNIQQQLRNSQHGVDDALSDEIPIDVPTAVTLPAAELGNLPEIETTMRIMSTTTNGRDALSKSVMADDYIGKLIPLVEMAEDLESLQDLHRLCNIMKTIILLNDTTIIEHAVSDDCVLGVVGALEYDPDFPQHKANHRHWLDNQGRYKEVVPIEDETTRRKIHQTYRLQYLKDVVLARILDDPTFSVLNSLIFFNQVDIVQHLQANVAFLDELFAIFSPSSADSRKKKEAVLFIQQCCAIAKNIQPPARQTLYNNFIAHGLLSVIHYGLRHADTAVRVGATDILISIIDHDPHMIKQTIYRQIVEQQPLLTDSLIELLLVEVDLGVKSQISEALKVLLDMGPQGNTLDPMGRNNGDFAGRARQQPLQSSIDPQQDLFLSKFYENSAIKLFRPLIDLENRASMEFPVQQASMFSYLADILCFFTRNHNRQSKEFVMKHNLVSRIAQLLQSSEKYLRLVSIRFFRHLLSLQEDLYLKHLIEKKVLGPILQVAIQVMPRDNLLCSAALEFFDYVRKENIKDVISHLVANHRESLAALSYHPTFRELVVRYDQMQVGLASDVGYFLEDDEIPKRPQTPPIMPFMGQNSIADDAYWTTSDPEDEEEAGHANAKSPLINGSSTPSKPLVDYDSNESGEENDDAELESRGTSSTEPQSSKAKEGPAAPLERVSEKRRREEEEEEDEMGKLAARSKRRNSSSSASSTSSTTSRRRKSFTASSGNGPSKSMTLKISTALKSGGPETSDGSN